MILTYCRVWSAEELCRYLEGEDTKVKQCITGVQASITGALLPDSGIVDALYDSCGLETIGDYEPTVCARNLA